MGIVKETSPPNIKKEHRMAKRTSRKYVPSENEKKKIYVKFKKSLHLLMGNLDF